jgi:pimeloyl-ACP methyl ester carboxylesterase
MEKEINYKGSKIVYATQGSGPVVVLVHGFGEDNFVWNRLLPLLNNYRFIIPHLPGSGASESIDDMSLDGLAQCLHAILKNEEVDKCVLIGHSMGGYITLSFAEQFSPMLLGFGLFHSSAFADSEEKKETRRKGIKFMEENGANAFLKTAVPNLYAPATKKENAALIEEHLLAVQNQQAPALINYYEAMINRKDKTHLLKDSSLPILFVLGRWDTAVPLEDGLKQCHLPQLSYIEILNGSGHMGMIEEVEKSAAIVNQFLSATL